jgi:hypothetical protein
VSIPSVHIGSVLSTLPNEIVSNLLIEYRNIKQQYFLKKFLPTELNSGRFAECVTRLLQHIDIGTYTPFGKTLPKTDTIFAKIENNVSLADTLRIFIPRLLRVLLDVRNKRDVAHVGGEVNPNFSDAKFVLYACDWVMTEIVRHFHNCSINDAAKIVDELNTVVVPIIFEVQGFVKILDTNLDAKEKTLAILYFKDPEKVTEKNLLTWVGITQMSNYRSRTLRQLDKDAYIHLDKGYCLITPKGKLYVEKHIPAHLLIV